MRSYGNNPRSHHTSNGKSATFPSRLALFSPSKLMSMAVIAQKSDKQGSSEMMKKSKLQSRAKSFQQLAGICKRFGNETELWHVNWEHLLSEITETDALWVTLWFLHSRFPPEKHNHHHLPSPPAIPTCCFSINSECDFISTHMSSLRTWALHII